MTDPKTLLDALRPLVERVRTDVTAIRRGLPGSPRQSWTNDALTDERLLAHLSGGAARGVCPIREGESTVRVATLDFDSHGGEILWPQMAAVAGDVMARLQALGLHPVAFRSTGGRGVHLHVIWDAPQDAYSVRGFMADVLRTANLKSGAKGLAAGEVEVFPKQDRVEVGGFGNQWILPLAGKSELLELCDLTDTLVRSANTLQASDWRGGQPVPHREKPAPVARERVAIVEANAEGTPKWRLALDALTNTGANELGYDDWLRVIAAIYQETAGSSDGLALAESWSARSAKHDAEFLEHRVWAYLRTDRDPQDQGAHGPAICTGGSIMSLAARLHDWSGSRTPAEIAAEYGPAEDPDEARALAHRERVAARLGLAVGPGAAVEAPLVLCETDDDDISGLGAAAANMIALAAAAQRREKARVLAAQAASGGSGGPGAGGGVSGDEWDGEAEFERLLERAGIPKAEHLCTDQANANRLVRAFGAHLLVAGGHWHVWTGTHWHREEAGLYRYACGLSRLVKEEAARVRRKAAARGPDPAALKVADAIAVALDKWSTKCESAGTIAAAVGLLRKMLTVDEGSLDRSPWLLNVRNGTLDLRSGTLRAHSADDRITKFVDVDYLVAGKDAGSASVAAALDRDWSRVVLEICGGDVALAGFLRRWAGYCSTGSVREQKFAVWWGGGGNGKSLILKTLQGVLGSGASGYAGTAGDGLMTRAGGGGSAVGGGSPHSSAVVALMGKRLIVAHESTDGAALAEAFVKRATGDDKMDARYLYGEQFEFDPSHKLNLLSNYRPVIKGQDAGIWRRVMLIPFCVSFGSAAEVARGEARVVADKELSARFTSAAGREAVLRWCVEGAREWLEGGLREPDAVLAAGASYRVEQDRVRAFLDDCCDLGVAFTSVLVGPAGDGLYPAYQSWAKESGLMALSKPRLVQELQRVVPGFVSKEGRATGGSRKKIRVLQGLRVAED